MHKRYFKSYLFGARYDIFIPHNIGIVALSNMRGLEIFATISRDKYTKRC